MVASPSRSTVEGPSTVAVGDGRSKDFENSPSPFATPPNQTSWVFNQSWPGGRIAGWEPAVLSSGAPPPIRAQLLEPGVEVGLWNWGVGTDPRF
jgi:hypothetical protein